MAVDYRHYLVKFLFLIGMGLDLRAFPDPMDLSLNSDYSHPSQN